MSLRRALALLLSLACTDPPAELGDGGVLGDAGVDLAEDLPDMPLVLDTDGDGLLDTEEGYADGLGPDTDGDGVPDGEDLDSDADGLPDALEALPRQVSGAPSDANGDGRPDFREPDCDGNGRLDGVDAFLVGDVPGDLDRNGVADFRDPDDDGDMRSDVLELGEDPASPQDSDADGTPDFRDRDSDDDTILDAHEQSPAWPDWDWDGDGTPNALDLDADDDGFPDAEEAGDEDLETFPVDTDLDGSPDFLDTDADDDGVFDDVEHARGTSPRTEDTDGDRVNDLLEILAGTDANDPADTPASRGWLLAVVDFRMPAVPDVFAPGLRHEIAADEAPARVAVAVRDDGEGAQFLDGVEVEIDAPGCDDVPAEDTDGDGHADAFLAPPPGSTLCWSVVPRPNRTVPRRLMGHPVASCRMEGGDTTLFSATLEVVADEGVVGSTRYLAWVPPGSSPVGPDDPRCTSCVEDPRCLMAGPCPCL